MYSYFFLFFFFVYLCIFFFFFFFFQAEDGIRDLTVTGVQTCALPILAHLHNRRDRFRVRYLRNPDAAAHRQAGAGGTDRRRAGIAAVSDVGRRSEERRVGKECRSGWSPEQ